MDELTETTGEQPAMALTLSSRTADDLAATGDVYVMYAALLRRVAVGKFGIPRPEAEELVHDVFINFLAMDRPVRDNVRAYLVAAVCNACRNYWRSRRSQDRVFVDETAAPDAITADDGSHDVAVNLLVAATLARLGERCRTVLKRYYLDGEDTPTIAAALNTSPSNVNYLMHVCRKRARGVYDQISRAR